MHNERYDSNNILWAKAKESCLIEKRTKPTALPYVNVL